MKEGENELVKEREIRRLAKKRIYGRRWRRREKGMKGKVSE